MAAAKAAKASRRAIRTIRVAVMSDGVERIDEEIWIEARKLGLISSLAVINHARLALSEAGILVDTGARRKTSEGCLARVWRTTEPVTRARMDFVDGAPPNAKHANKELVKKLKAAEEAFLRARNKLIDRVSSAAHDLVLAKFHGRVAEEQAAQIRYDALNGALLDLFGA